MQKYILKSCFYLLSITFLLLSNISYAENTPALRTVKIKGNQIINSPVTYKNVALDLTEGHFILGNAGAIDIQDSTINVTISPSNPYFILSTSGLVRLKNNRIIVSSSMDIPQTPEDQSIYYLLRMNGGSVDISNNTFEIDTFFSVGFLITDQTVKTKNFFIGSNTIRNFHGGIYLINSDSAVVSNNRFINVSFSNLFNIGNGSTFIDNAFKFPGNLRLGDAIDILNSNNISCIRNTILSSASYGISAIGSQNILLDSNRIGESKSHGIFITTPMTTNIKSNKFLSKLLANYPLQNITNQNITVINNYLSQNRFGLAAEHVSGLNVQFNAFIQRFSDDASRQFWTSNDNLLKDVSDLTWVSNLYKEAYTQEVPGDNTKSIKFYPYPQTGGVVLG